MKCPNEKDLRDPQGVSGPPWELQGPPRHALGTPQGRPPRTLQGPTAPPQTTKAAMSKTLQRRKRSIGASEAFVATEHPIEPRDLSESPETPLGCASEPARPMRKSCIVSNGPQHGGERGYHNAPAAFSHLYVRYIYLYIYGNVSLNLCPGGIPGKWSNSLTCEGAE